ncbi:WD40 repeat-like protein [Teratosphaeria nubilosa]|uniref:WD40 repeat-like protein n=1 Tax=Teratosphaeria nubilosa TaxID=161662 RepID=A0A6G1LAF2_9PEZI|nr:WD40 repeat-like protein [Teratosphaeria nubilosa]
MRLDQHNSSRHEQRPRPSTNGSSSQENGSSPAHTNGSANGTTETNGFSSGASTNGHGGVGLERSSEPFYGHDREEVTRILLQSLSDLGYHGAARQLSGDSGYELEIPSVAAFRQAVLSGEWDDAEALLFGGEAQDSEGGVSLGNGHTETSTGHGWSKRRTNFASSSNGSNGRQGLPLADGADVVTLRFYLRQQKYLELLERRENNAALMVLRNELTPLKRDINRLHELSSLIMCLTAEDLRQQAEWDGAAGESRALLLSEISKSISPSIMIPEHRLATLLSANQEEQILSCRYHNTTAQPSLYTDHECSADDFPSQVLVELRNHADEVWFLEFSHDGSMLATSGKDGLVCIYDTSNWRIRHEIREHDRSGVGEMAKGVCCVAFSPDDEYLISCSQNNSFAVTSTRDGRRVAYGDHFDYPVTSAAWLPNSSEFIIGSQSSERPLGLYSLRPANGSSNASVVKNNNLYTWRDPPFDSSLRENPPSYRITDCAVDPRGERMVATTTDNFILSFDLGTRMKIGEWQMEDKLQSINFGVDGTQILVNMNEQGVFALDARTGEILGRYEGMVQKEYVVRSCFGGAGENFVVSGSEDSRVWIWRRQTGAQVAVLEAHGPGTVNAVAWHPTNHAIFASAGDDRRVKIWTSASALRQQHAEAGASRSSLGSYQQGFGR